MLGGESYWPHGVESLRSDAFRRGALFACVPGEMDWNAALAARGTLGARRPTRSGAIAARAASKMPNSRCVSSHI